LVYAGAVMVLFLFVIMLLNIKSEVSHRMHWFGVATSIFIIPVLMYQLTQILKASDSPTIVDQNFAGTTKAIGKLLFSNYLIPFEVASVLLLMAMVGVIVLSKKETKS